MLLSVKTGADDYPFEINSFLHILNPDNMECAICGCKIKKDESFRIDDYGTAVCGRHKNVKKCSLCRRFIKESPVLVPSFGNVCPECGTRHSYEEAIEVSDFVNRFYARKRIFIPGYRLCLLSAEEMVEKYKNHFNPIPLGVARKDDVENEYRIDIMRQQSKVSIASTLAHELLHLWQYHRGIYAPKAYSEGFCNLGAFLVVATVNKDESLVILSRMMENPDPEYGVAFRRLKVLHDVYGWRAVVKAMKQFAV